MTKAKRQDRLAKCPTDYVMFIERWDWSYSFGLNPIRRESDPYMEFRHLTLFGALLRPLRLENEKAELTVIPSRDLDASNRFEREKPLGVGSLERNRNMKINQGYLSMPLDVLSTILPMLVADRLKFVVFRGIRIGLNRHVTMSSYRLQKTVDEDDMYSEE